MSATDFTWSCQCGAVEARFPRQKALPVTCYCTFCRHFLTDFGRADVLEAAGGVGYLHMTPDRIDILRGRELLEVVHYSRRGGRRWYASCCNTPFANTFASVQIPYVTITSAWVHPAGEIPPARIIGFRQSALSEPKPRQRAYLRSVATMVLRGALSRVTGRYRRTPFFGADGEPSKPLHKRPGPPRPRA